LVWPCCCQVLAGLQSWRTLRQRGNPLSSLMTGILATVLQAVSTTGLCLLKPQVLDIEHGIYLVMGAASASVTSTIVSLAHTVIANNLNAPLPLTVHDHVNFMTCRNPVSLNRHWLSESGDRCVGGGAGNQPGVRGKDPSKVSLSKI
jgi:hypothetical protein